MAIATIPAISALLKHKAVEALINRRDQGNPWSHFIQGKKLYRMTELKKMLDRIERFTLRYLQEINSRLERMDLRQIRMDEKLNKILEHQD